MAVLWAHLSAPPPSVTARRTDLSPAVDHVVGRGLAKDPAARYPSCGAFADALRVALGAGPYSVPVPYRGPGTAAGRRGLLAAAAAVGLAGTVTAAILLYPGSGEPGQASGTRTASTAATQATNPDHGALLTSAALSIDATIVAASDASGRTYLWDAATGTPLGTVSDPGGAGMRSLAINVMGTQLAIADKNGTTYVWNLPS